MLNKSNSKLITPPLKLTETSKTVLAKKSASRKLFKRIRSARFARRVKQPLVHRHGRFTNPIISNNKVSRFRRHIRNQIGQLHKHITSFTFTNNTLLRRSLLESVQQLNNRISHILDSLITLRFIQTGIISHPLFYPTLPLIKYLTKYAQTSSSTTAVSLQFIMKLAAAPKTNIPITTTRPFYLTSNRVLIDYKNKLSKRSSFHLNNNRNFVQLLLTKRCLDLHWERVKGRKRWKFFKRANPGRIYAHHRPRWLSFLTAF